MNIIKYLFFTLLLSTYLFSNVILKVPNTFIKNEPLIFELEVVGNDVVFPKIDSIAGYKVQSAASYSSILNINSKITKKQSKKYRLFPKNDITIPSFTFIIDNKEYKTKSKKITQEKIKKTNSKYADLQIEISKKEVYVGEEFKLKLIFKYRKDLNIVDMGFADINLENFWYKRLDTNKKYEKNNFVYQELEFLMFAQKDGYLPINPLRIDMQVLDVNSNSFSFFSNASTLYKIYSNSLSLKVNPLPQKISLIGDFDIKTSIDKTSINEGESISYKINIKGFGNIEDTKDFKLNLENSTIYENKAKIDTKIKDGKYFGTYEKVFSILPSNNLKIPSITLEYFDKKNKKIITKKSLSYEVKVNKLKVEEKQLETVNKTNNLIKEKIVRRETTLKEKIFFFSFGFLVCLLIFCLYLYVIKLRIKKTIEQIPLFKLIKKANSKDELIKILVPVLNKEKELDKKIFELEKSKDLNEFKTIQKDILTIIKKIKKREKNETSSTIFN